MEDDLNTKFKELSDKFDKLADEFYKYNTTSAKVETKSVRFMSRIGFFKKVPIEQPNAIPAPGNAGGGYNQTQNQEVVDAVNSIRTTLANLGLIKP